MTTSPGRGPALRGRFRAGDDTGSLAMALMLTLVGVTLSAVLAPMVVAQIGSTRVTMQRTDALNAAQAGLDVALGQIKAAKDSAGNGVIQQLPCGLPQRSVAPGNTATYQVGITYLATDPGSGGAAGAITCVAGSGAASAPAYVLLESTGTAGSSSRTLSLTYRFKVTRQPIRGGLIHLTGTSLCLDAGSTSPADGTSLQVQPCSPDNPQQQFAYGKNLNLYLASTRTSDTQLGMCLDAGTPHVAGPPVQFKACVSPTQPRQQWSFDDAARFQGTKDGTNLDGFCFSAASPYPGSTVVLLSCAAGASFSPEASAGAGAARPSPQQATGTSPQQLVNLSQFGRCMDVTNFDVNKGFLIVWPCKQAPSKASIGWNQMWSLPAVASGTTSAPGPITTDATNGATTGRYCLRSRGTTAAFQYVTVELCPANLALAPEWTVYGDTGDDLTSYHIRDEYGYCLSPTDPSATPPDFFTETNGYRVSKLVVAVCSRSRLQRWNSSLDAGLEELSEQ
jgi:hypothetical protein